MTNDDYGSSSWELNPELGEEENEDEDEEDEEEAARKMEDPEDDGGSIGANVSLASLMNEEEIAPNDETDTDAWLARELTHMTIQEREQVFHDIHGVSDTVSETPDLLADSLKELDRCLEVLVNKERKRRPNYDTTAYQLARSTDAAFVQETRLLFLRCDQFRNIPATAKKFIQFWNHKLQLFGPDLLTKPITLRDLSKDVADFLSLESGFLQLLPARDSAGRAVLCGQPCFKKYTTLENLVRVYL